MHLFTLPSREAVHDPRVFWRVALLDDGGYGGHQGRRIARLGTDLNERGRRAEWTEWQNGRMAEYDLKIVLLDCVNGCTHSATLPTPPRHCSPCLTSCYRFCLTFMIQIPSDLRTQILSDLIVQIWTVHRAHERLAPPHVQHVANVRLNSLRCSGLTRREKGSRT